MPARPHRRRHQQLTAQAQARGRAAAPRREALREGTGTSRPERRVKALRPSPNRGIAAVEELRFAATAKLPQRAGGGSGRQPAQSPQLLGGPILVIQHRPDALERGHPPDAETDMSRIYRAAGFDARAGTSRRTQRRRLRDLRAPYLAGAADRGGGNSASRSAASTWKRSTASGKPRNRQAPRLLRLTPSASDSLTAARTAEDIKIWPP